MPSLTARVTAATVALRVLYTDTPGGVPDVVLATVPVDVASTDPGVVADGLRPVSVPLGETPAGRRLALVALGAAGAGGGPGAASPLSGVVTAGAPVEPLPAQATYTVADRAAARALTGYAAGETVRITTETHDAVFVYTASGRATDGGTCMVPLNALGSEETVAAPAGTTLLGADVSWDDVRYQYAGAASFPAGKLHGSGLASDGTGGLDLSGPIGAFSYAANSLGAMPGTTERTVRLRRATGPARLERVVAPLALRDPQTGTVAPRTDYVRPEWWRHPDTGLPTPTYAAGYTDDASLPAPGTDRLNHAASAQHGLCWAERVAHQRARARALAAGLNALPVYSAVHNVPVVLSGLYGYHAPLLRRPGVDWLAADNRTVSSDRPGGSVYGTLGYLGGLTTGGQPLARIGVKAARGSHYRFLAIRTATGGYGFGRQPEDWLYNEGTPYPVVVACPGRGYARTGALEIDGGLFENEELMAGQDRPEMNLWRENSGPGGGSFNTAAYSAIRNSSFGSGFSGGLGPFDGVPGDVQRHDVFGLLVHSCLGTCMGSSGYTGFGGSLLKLRDAAGNHHNYQIHQGVGQTLERVEVAGIDYATAWEPYMGTYGTVVIRDIPQTPYSWMGVYESVGGRRAEDTPVGDHLTARATKPHHGRGYFENDRQIDLTHMPAPTGGGIGGFVMGGDAPYVLDRLTVVAPPTYDDRMVAGYGGQFDSKGRIGTLGTPSVVQGKMRSLLRSDADTHYRDLFIDAAFSQYELSRYGISLDSDRVISWYGGSAGLAFGSAYHGSTLLFTSERDRMKTGGPGTRPSTLRLFLRDFECGAEQLVVDIGGGDAVFPASELDAGGLDAAGLRVYCLRVKLRRAPTARELAWSYFQQTTVKGGRTSEASGSLAASALAAGTIDVPVNLFAPPQAAGFVTVTGPDAGRFTGWTNVGTDAAPVLRLAFTGSAPVTVAWSAAVRPLPAGLVWPADDPVPASGPVATGALVLPTLTDGDAPLTVDLGALFAYDSQSMATTGAVRYALVEPYNSGGLATVTGHTLTLDPTGRGDTDVEVWVRCQDEWGRYADLRAPLRIDLKPVTVYPTVEDAILSHQDLVAYWPANAAYPPAAGGGGSWKTPNLKDATNPLSGTAEPVAGPTGGYLYREDRGQSDLTVLQMVGALQGRSWAMGMTVHNGVANYTNILTTESGGAGMGFRHNGGEGGMSGGAYGLKIQNGVAPGSAWTEADWQGAYDLLVVFEVLANTGEYCPSQLRVYRNGGLVVSKNNDAGGISPWAVGETLKLASENAVEVSQVVFYSSDYRVGGWLRDAEVAQIYAERGAAGS